MVQTIWDELWQMQDEMDDLFNSITGRSGRNLLAPNTTPTALAETRKPLTDVYETKDEMIISSELPGVDKKDIDINVHKDAIEFRVEHKEEEKDEDKKHFRYERSCKSFYRRVPLPRYVDGENAKAKYDNGILEIHIPKKPEEIDAKKKIAIE